MDVFQIILLINLCVLIAYFIVSMITLKVMGINPLGKRKSTKNIFGIVTLVLSTVWLFFIWTYYIIDPRIATYFLSFKAITELPVIKWIAVALISLAALLEIISASTIGKSGRIHSPTEKTKLIKKGIYGISRNPIVVGMFLFGFGMLLLNPNLLSLFMMGLLLHGYNNKVDTEAQQLEEFFGDEWHKYCKQTGKYFPKIMRS
jgi:protein-S-isoprenylcysteine O-methyltransferase Ste14